MTPLRQYGNLFISQSPDKQQVRGVASHNRKIPILADIGTFRYPPAHDRGHAGAQPLPAHPVHLPAAGLPVRPPLRQAPAPVRPRADPRLPAFPGHREEARARLDRHRGLRPALPVPRHPQEGLGHRGGPARSQAAAQAARRRQARGSPAFPRLRGGRAAPRHPDRLLRGRPAHLGSRQPATDRHRQPAHGRARRPGQGPQGPLRHALAAAARDPPRLLVADPPRGRLAVPGPDSRAALRPGCRQQGQPRRLAPVRHPQAAHASLRHAFAVHLLESGVDVRTIQLLLGHRSLATTARYLQLACSKVCSATSPLDLLPLPQAAADGPQAAR